MNSKDNSDSENHILRKDINSLSLDVATEIEPTLQNDAETQTYVSTEGVSTQTLDTVEKDVTPGTANTLVKPGKVDTPVIPGKPDTVLDDWLDFPFLRDELSIKQLQVENSMPLFF